jgi:phospholipase C
MSQCGYRKLQIDRARSHWLITVTRTCIEWADKGSERCSASASIVKWVCTAWYSIARFVCLLFANIVNFLWLIVTYVVWVPCKLLFPNKKKQDRIKHVFVVMLENRSFDHMLGLSNIQGIDAISGQPTSIDGLNENNNWNVDPNGNTVFVTSPADWAMPHDPGHEFEDVKEQLCGLKGNYPAINNSGFVTNYSGTHHFDNPAEIMKCYSPDQLPVLTILAQEFAVCDHWYSSMPGPTWPNRFFVHAASSGGLDHSPSALDVGSSLLFNGYKFDNGTIYDRLDDEEIDWKIYKGDAFPQSLAISGMNLKLLEGCFIDFEDFNSDVSDPGYSTSYVFIEPNYGHIIGGNFKCGNSQHPLDDVTRGERLLKHIYETIRNSPHWESSVLVIMYDEHGGFYDHVAPPATVAPGDSVTDPENSRYNFDFKQLGVRIPVVIVSPLIPKGTIDHTLYDHTSVLATVENIFGLQPLTGRDKHANAFKHLFSLATPRTDAPTTLPEPANSGIQCEDDMQAGASITKLDVRAAPDATEPVDPSLQGFVHVAFLRDLHVSPPEEKERLAAKYVNVSTKLDAQQYMEKVRQKVKGHKQV